MKKFMALGGCLLFLLSTLWVRNWTAATPAYHLHRIAVDSAGGGDGAISPDGKQFVISSKRSGNWELWSYDMMNSTWKQLTNDPADDFEGRWSPDGKKIVFCSTRAGQKNIWILNLEDGACKQLTFSKNDEEYPAWSPDGKYVIYTSGAWGARNYYIIPSEGGAPRRITDQAGLGGACTFEPNGDSVICHRYDLGSGNLLRVRLSDGGVNMITLGNAWDYKPTTSPDGRWIAFSRSEEGPSHIWLLPSAANSSPRQLTQSPYDDRWPVWNAAGNLLFFHRIVERGTALKILNRKTGELRTLVGEDEHPLQASFDPQARHVVYCSQAEGRKTLKILDLRTGQIRALNTGSGEADFPRWSPDGTSIAFVSKRGPRWEVCLIKPDGSGLVNLTEGIPNLHGMDGPIDWSPDGSKIVFHADTRPFEALIFIIEVRTHRLTNITSGAWFDESPSWTPDGRGIVFMTTRGGNWTWSFFKLSLQDGHVDSLAGPDWVEKNFPRMDADGFTIWSMHGEYDKEVLAERAPKGDVRILSKAGSGARWPSYSSDRAWILFTAIEHQVEYWIAENPFGEGSPLTNSSSASGTEEATADNSEVCQAEKIQHSTNDKFRR